MIEKPQTSAYGGVIAAPIFREIAKYTLNYLKIFPMNERVNLQKMYCSYLFVSRCCHFCNEQQKHPFCNEQQKHPCNSLSE